MYSKAMKIAHKKNVGWAKAIPKAGVISNQSMNIVKLIDKLKSLGVSPSTYSLNGGLPSEKYCLSNESGKWFVYYSERGQRTGENSFANETDACKYFLGQIERDPTTRI